MDLMKRITTYFTILTFTLTGVPISSIASEGDEDAGSFDDPDTKLYRVTFVWFKL